jgi:hypothetical protein
MKTIFPLLLLAIIINTGCGSSSSEKNKITGTWTVTTAYEQRSELQNKYPTNSDRETDSLLKAQFAGMVYNFSADGKVIVTIGSEKKEAAWQMLKDDKSGKEVSAIEIKGNGWEETWFPAIGESLFYMKGIDNAINVKLLQGGEEGMTVLLELSKTE